MYSNNPPVALWFWNSATIFQHQWKCTCLSDRKTQWSLIIFPLSLSYGLETMSVVYRTDFVLDLSHVESSAHVWVTLALSWFDHVVQTSENKCPLKLCLSYSLRRVKIIKKCCQLIPCSKFQEFNAPFTYQLKIEAWERRERGEQGLQATGWISTHTDY